MIIIIIDYKTCIIKIILPFVHTILVYLKIKLLIIKHTFNITLQVFLKN